MNHSFIPYDIRRDFSLPTHHHKNSVYAYHFYRLLQRAANIHLIYNTEPDELGGGEKSRFIKQIQQELPAYNKKIRISEQLLATQPSAGSFIPEITIEKSEEIFDCLKGLAAKGFAPTSMNAYRRCRLQFYFSAIAGIEEPKEQEETIDPQILGQAVHEVLHNLYKPFIDKFLSGEFITSMIPLIREYTDKAFEKKFKGSDLAYGKNLLLVNVAKIMITNFLNEEKRIIEQLSDSGTRVSVKFLEQFIESRMAIQTGNENLDVRIKGFVDRVDQYGSVLRIIDYKTGFADKKELQFDDWSQFITSPDMDKCFQLLTYAWLMNQKEGIKTEQFEAGIISLKKISSGFLSLSLPGNDRQGIIDPSSLKTFEGILSKLLTEIFDPAIPFDQTEDLKICSMCPYINLCGR
jgi:ATP-dependent helicase/nuclease subunit B